MFRRSSLIKTVKMIQKAGKKARLDVSMELIRDKRYEIRDTRWRFNFVNSLDQFIYFTHLIKFSIITRLQLRAMSCGLWAYAVSCGLWSVSSELWVERCGL